MNSINKLLHETLAKLEIAIFLKLLVPCLSIPYNQDVFEIGRIRDRLFILLDYYKMLQTGRTSDSILRRIYQTFHHYLEIANVIEIFK